MTNNEKDMAEVICKLRAELRCVSSLLLGVLEDGFPGKGRGQDAKEAAEQWWEDRYLAVKKSEELLEATDEYRGVVVV